MLLIKVDDALLYHLVQNPQLMKSQSIVSFYGLAQYPFFKGESAAPEKYRLFNDRYVSSRAKHLRAVGQIFIENDFNFCIHTFSNLRLRHNQSYIVKFRAAFPFPIGFEPVQQVEIEILLHSFYGGNAFLSIPQVKIHLAHGDVDLQTVEQRLCRHQAGCPIAF